MTHLTQLLHDPPHPTPAWPTPPHTYMPTPSPHHPTPVWPTPPMHNPPTPSWPTPPVYYPPSPAWLTQPLYDPPHLCMTHPTPIGWVPFGRHAALWLFHWLYFPYIRNQWKVFYDAVPYCCADISFNFETHDKNLKGGKLMHNIKSSFSSISC